jgi:hypothetical protein
MEEKKEETKIDLDNLNIQNIFKMEIVNLLEQLINELELSFDYVKNNNIEIFNNHINEIKKNDELFNEFVLDYIEKNKLYESILSKVVSNKTKLKKQEFEFLNNIILFNLNFEIFKDENKNTKKTLIKYLYNIYMTCSVLSNFKNLNNGNFQELLQFMNNFKLERETFNNDIEVSSNSLSQTKKNKKYSKNTRNLNSTPGMPNLMAGMSGMPGMSGIAGMSGMFNNLLNSNFMNNPHIKDIVNDISNDIENQNIDPLTILNSMMTGNGNPSVNNLISNITNKLENKINNGEIDKNDLQDEASKMISSIENTPILQSFLSQQKNTKSKKE